MRMNAASANPAGESNADGLTRWIRYLYRHYPEIKSVGSLQGYIETLFESNFDAETDQIGYMRQQVSSEIYQR